MKNTSFIQALVFAAVLWGASSCTTSPQKDASYETTAADTFINSKVGKDLDTLPKSSGNNTTSANPGIKYVENEGESNPNATRSLIFGKWVKNKDVMYEFSKSKFIMYMSNVPMKELDFQVCEDCTKGAKKSENGLGLQFSNGDCMEIMATTASSIDLVYYKGSKVENVSLIRYN